MPDFHIEPGKVSWARLDDHGNVIEAQPIEAPDHADFTTPTSDDDPRVFSLQSVTVTWMLRVPATIPLFGRLWEWLLERLWLHRARWN